MATIPVETAHHYNEDFIPRAIEAVTALHPVWRTVTDAAMNRIAHLDEAQQQEVAATPSAPDVSFEAFVSRIENFVQHIGATAYQAVQDHLQTIPKQEHSKIMDLVQRHGEFVWWEQSGVLPPLHTSEAINHALAARVRRLTLFGVHRVIALMTGADEIARHGGAENPSAVVQNSGQLAEQFARRKDAIEARTGNILKGLPGDLPETYGGHTDLRKILSRAVKTGMMIFTGSQVVLDIPAIRTKLRALPPLQPHETVSGPLKGCYVDSDGIALLWKMLFTELQRSGYFAQQEAHALTITGRTVSRCPLPKPRR
jgi:hypothetical protein